jgi:vacuolar-type H+-ATPase subunit D/Vma8
MARGYTHERYRRIIDDMFGQWKNQASGFARKGVCSTSLDETTLRAFMKLLTETQVIRREIVILERELRVTTQRVNLFEKIKAFI